MIVGLLASVVRGLVEWIRGLFVSSPVSSPTSSSLVHLHYLVGHRAHRVQYISTVGLHASSILAGRRGDDVAVDDDEDEVVARLVAATESMRPAEIETRLSTLSDEQRDVWMEERGVMEIEAKSGAECVSLASVGGEGSDVFGYAGILRYAGWFAMMRGENVGLKPRGESKRLCRGRVFMGSGRTRMEDWMSFGSWEVRLPGREWSYFGPVEHFDVVGGMRAGECDHVRFSVAGGSRKDRLNASMFVIDRLAEAGSNCAMHRTRSGFDVRIDQAAVLDVKAVVREVVESGRWSSCRVSVPQRVVGFFVDEANHLDYVHRGVVGHDVVQACVSWDPYVGPIPVVVRIPRNRFVFEVHHESPIRILRELAACSALMLVRIISKRRVIVLMAAEMYESGFMNAPKKGQLHAWWWWRLQDIVRYNARLDLVNVPRAVRIAEFEYVLAFDGDRPVLRPLDDIIKS